MANPYQQQVRLRKFIYTGCIIVLLGGAWLWREYSVNAQARELHIREQSRGEVDLTGSVVRLSLIGSRGVATCVLWNMAIERQKKNQWNELELIVRSLTKLQPHFITPWLYQSWNLAYNVSVESDQPRDKYFYITRGIQLLAEGERRNHNHPDLRWSIGFYTQHKIGRSDETNILRSIFQLSYIPPDERDPTRFWVESEGRRTLNREVFAEFCKKHPQLIRRLARGVRREDKRQWDRQFTCEKPEDVVQFLADHWRIPSTYTFDEDKQQYVKIKRSVDRFPVLPPEHTPEPNQQSAERIFSRSFLDDASNLDDNDNCFAVAKAWYAYAQEPLPKPGELPGSSEEIKDRAIQGRPKHMTTLLFRLYPAHAQRFIAERLQEEGWFLDEGWEIKDWYRGWPPGRELDPRRWMPTRIGHGENKSAKVQSSQEAWKISAQMLQAIGTRNHLILNPAEEENKRRAAQRFRTDPRYRYSRGRVPPNLRKEKLTEQGLWQDYQDARYLDELEFYRNLCRFPYQYARAQVESKENGTTVRARKVFYDAHWMDLNGSPDRALALYERRLDPKVDKNTLEIWRDQVLTSNEEYWKEISSQEFAAELQWRYLKVWNDLHGSSLRKQIDLAGRVVPMLPPTRFRKSLPVGPRKGATALPSALPLGPFDFPKGGEDSMEAKEDRSPVLRPGVYERAVMELDPTVRRQLRSSAPSSQE